MDERNRMGLEPIEPRTAKKLYLREKATEASDSTVKAHDYRLRHFVRWCDEKDLDNLNDLTGRLLKEYRLWRTEEGSLNKVTVKTQMDTLRVFIRWCEAIDAVEMDLSEKVQSPTLDTGDNQRDAILDAEEAEAILEYLSTYHYASFGHALMATLWEAPTRAQALRGDLMEHTGMWFPHRRSELESYLNSMRGQIIRKLRESVEVAEE